MAMVVVDDSSLQVDSQPKSGGLVSESAAAWCCSLCLRFNGLFPGEPELAGVY